MVLPLELSLWIKVLTLDDYHQDTSSNSKFTSGKEEKTNVQRIL